MDELLGRWAAGRTPHLSIRQPASELLGGLSLSRAADQRTIKHGAISADHERMGPFLRSALFPMVVIVVLIYVASQTFLSGSEVTPVGHIAYRDLLRQVEKTPSVLESVVFFPGRRGIEATFVGGDTLESSYSTQSSRLRLEVLLERQGVFFTSQGTGGSKWPSILTYLLPFALFFGFWIFLMSRMERARERPPRLPDDELGNRSGLDA